MYKRRYPNPANRRRYIKRKKPVRTYKKAYRPYRIFRPFYNSSGTQRRNTRNLYPMIRKQRLELVSDDIKVTPASTSTNYIFAVNAIWDPLLTTGTSQPRGYDELAAVYRKYMVTSGKIAVRFQNETPNQIRSSCAITPDSTSATSIRYLAELKNGYEGKTITTQFDKIALIRKFRVRSYYRMESKEDISAQFGNNPSKLLYFQCRLKSIASGSLANIVGTMQIHIYFNVTVWDPITIVPSVQSAEVNLANFAKIEFIKEIPDNKEMEFPDELEKANV